LRILVLGAGGFIGRHIMAELLRSGHQPIGAVRRVTDFARAFPGVAAVACDLARDVSIGDWLPRVAGIDIVVNAAGVLSGAEMEAVHVTAPRALYEACAEAGVKRVVLISAISARPEVDTDYARAKLAGERLLQAGPLDWTILKPSLIVAKGSYGGTSLIRGLAGLPLFAPLVGDGHFAFSPLHAQDLARTVRVVCEEGRFSGQVLEPAGPEIISLRDLLSRYRAWLGLPPAPFLSIPMRFMRLLAGFGDRMGRGPISSNSLAQLIAGNEGDGQRFAREIGFTPRSLTQFMAEEPAEVQDRWHARLFFMAPVLKFALAAMWLFSGLIGLFTGLPLAQDVLATLGLPSGLAMPVVVLTCLIDLVICFLVLSGRKATAAQLIVIAGYTLVLTFALPSLWLDPLGPLLKNIPIVAAVLCHGVLREQR
jgi:uncharacterized protein YbjT (DUF2867 family)